MEFKFRGADMKKAKNIVLLIGIICNLLYILLQIFNFVYHCITSLPPINLKYFIIGDFVPILITIAILILPAILLIRNLKNKTGKVLPIISSVTVGFMGLLMLFSWMIPTIPQYLIYSKLGLIDTYFIILLNHFTSGGILVFAGFILLTVGSVMSIFKPKAE